MFQIRGQLLLAWFKVIIEFEVGVVLAGRTHHEQPQTRPRFLRIEFPENC